MKAVTAVICMLMLAGCGSTTAPADQAPSGSATLSMTRLNELTSPFLSKLIDTPDTADGDAAASTLTAAAAGASQRCRADIRRVASSMRSASLSPAAKRTRILDRLVPAYVSCEP